MVDRHVAGDRLSAFLDDELGEDDALAVTRHVAGCEVCLGELEGLRAARDALRSLPGLQAPVLERREQRPSRLAEVGRRVRVVLVACAVPVVVVVAAYVAGGIDGDVSPSTELFLVEHVSRTGGGPVPGPIGGSGR